jgi:transcriptional regulator with XRE-family HTH domain
MLVLWTAVGVHCFFKTASRAMLRRAERKGVQSGWNSRDENGFQPLIASGSSVALKKPSLAAFLKAQRSVAALTQSSLAQMVGVKPAYIAMLENAKRRPSLGLIAPLASALLIDRRELLELAYPEIRNIMLPQRQQQTRMSRAWQEFLKNAALLARYRVTRRELEVLQHVAALGEKMTTKRLLAILVLVRDKP